TPGSYARRVSRLCAALDQDLDGSFRGAALADELHGAMQIGVAARETLREREGVSRFHQDVKAPALDLRALAAVRFDDFRRLAHRLPIGHLVDEPCRGLFAGNSRVRYARVSRRPFWRVRGAWLRGRPARLRYLPQARPGGVSALAPPVSCVP